MSQGSDKGSKSLKLHCCNNNDNISNNNEDKKIVMSAFGCNETTASIEFARTIGKLKTTPRTGWVRRGVPNYESVADHSWRVAVLSLLFPPSEGLNITKCMEMAILHDMAECLVGDIAPDDNVPKHVKQSMESQAIHEIASTLSNGASKLKLLTLFEEYEERKSKEAKAVKDLDLLDMILQADEYEQQYGTFIDLDDFFQSTPPERFQTNTMQQIAKEIHKQRSQRMLLSQQRNEEYSNNDSVLCKVDSDFVSSYSKVAKNNALSQQDVEKVVLALREWERNNKPT